MGMVKWSGRLAALTLIVWSAGGLVEQEAQARSFRVEEVPNGNSDCSTCHIFPGGPRRPFGLQVEASLEAPLSSAHVDWSLLFRLDADGDGYSNGLELGDPEGVWTIGDPDPTLNSDPNDEFSFPAGEPDCVAEVCGDGFDNDCDGQVDEDCQVCEPSAEVCDGFDNDCDGLIDEGVLNACGQCGQVPAEVCDGEDNDCDGQIDEGLSCAPAVASFLFEAQSVTANNQDLQTFHLRVDNAGAVDEVRFTINHPWHSENGREFDGVFRVGPGLCGEVGTGSGNADIAVDTGSCQVTDNGDGTTDYTIAFRVLSTFGAATNNTVSVLLLGGGQILNTTWDKVTESGQGFDVEAGQGGGPAQLAGFSLGTQSVTANNQDLQTLRLSLSNAANVGEVRFMINHAWHAENGSAYDGYFGILADGSCREVVAGYGNDTVTINTAGCAVNATGNSREFVVPFSVLGTFGELANNTVSVLWYEGGVVTRSWLKVTAAGQGFNVVADPNFTPPSSLRSFAYDEPTVAPDGVEVQTFRVVLDSASRVTDLRLIINHPWHVENGRGYSGYFQITPNACREFVAGSGNADVTLLTDACERNANLDGSIEYVLSFAVEPSFGEADNNTVSAIWYEGSTVASGSWKKLTATGEGFDVAIPEAVTSSFVSFSYDAPEVVNDGVDVQTFRATFADADNITDVRFVINHPWHSENGRSYSGHFRVGPGGLCQEAVKDSATQGTDLVEPVPDGCAITTNLDGTVEFALSFVIEPDFPVIDNNVVSLLWYEGDVVIPPTWRRVTPGAGFDVVAP